MDIYGSTRCTTMPPENITLVVVLSSRFFYLYQRYFKRILSWFPFYIKGIIHLVLRWLMVVV